MRHVKVVHSAMNAAGKIVNMNYSMCPFKGNSNM